MSKIGKDELNKLKDDEKYISELLSAIKREELKMWIAHNLYTYSERAHWHKCMYWFCYLYCLWVPLLAAAFQVSENSVLKSILVILMGSVTIATGMTNGMKLREKWEHYRKYCEETKREISCCLNGLEIYKNNENPEILLGQRIDKLFQEEAQEWHKIKPDFPNRERYISRSESEDK